MRVRNLVGRKTAAVALLIVVVGIGLTGCLPETGAPPADPMTNDLLTALNRDRASVGLPALSWSPKLASNATAWASTMASQSSLHHQDLSSVLYSPGYASFRTLGENILVGPVSMSGDSMEAAWRASPPHWANITSQAFNMVGVGYFRGSDGRIWAVQEFGGI